MARMTISGFDEYIAKLEKLSQDNSQTFDDVVKAGAGVIADAVRSNLQALPVNNGYAPPGELLQGVTSVQKAGLNAGLGISPLRKGGNVYDRKVGFDGYNGQKTKKYPNGQPNSVIARSVCSGTSFRAKNDFVGRAVRSKRSDAENKMAKKFDEAIEKLMR